MHSSEPSGGPLGFVLTFPDGRSLYDTGDTWIFSDMALIEELYHPVVILLHVGGGYWGSDPKTGALEIKKYFKPDVIVSMHFGTLPEMSKESDVRAAFAGDKRLLVMVPGAAKSF
jgi:L-ascorbate metabolism protein UlaG (beta-lactamase superfamily)